MKILYFLPIITLYILGWVHWHKEQDKSWTQRSPIADMWIAINIIFSILFSIILAMHGLSKF